MNTLNELHQVSMGEKNPSPNDIDRYEKFINSFMKQNQNFRETEYARLNNDKKNKFSEIFLANPQQISEQVIRTISSIENKNKQQNPQKILAEEEKTQKKFIGYYNHPSFKAILGKISPMLMSEGSALLPLFNRVDNNLLSTNNSVSDNKSHPNPLAKQIVEVSEIPANSKQTQDYSRTSTDSENLQQDQRYKTNTIHKKEESIFEIISLRYLKSFVARFKMSDENTKILDSK
ncbi:MAG: hypothetical protein HQK50_16910 [Oligoflexia bacterium]|nr:hypothetical protein [Oligoflexia bacterium]